MGGYGLGEINAEGKFILDFSLAFHLTLANTCFRKRKEHLITYKSGPSFSQIDFFLVRKSTGRFVWTVKSYLGRA